MRNITTSGKFDNNNEDGLFKILEESPQLTFPQAIEEIGLDNMPTLYDLASFRKRMRDGNLIEQSNDDSPIRRYMWCNEYVGPAPLGHPAQGNLIMAKVEGMGEKTYSENTGFTQPIIPSHTQYVELSKTHMTSKLAFGNDVSFGLIQGFEEINGLQVPITPGAGQGFPLNQKKYDAMSEDHKAAFRKEIEFAGFGDISNSRGYESMPLALRPSSWSYLGFTTNNNSGFDFVTVDMRKLK